MTYWTRWTATICALVCRRRARCPRRHRHGNARAIRSAVCSTSKSMPGAASHIVSDAPPAHVRMRRSRPGSTGSKPASRASSRSVVPPSPPTPCSPRRGGVPRCAELGICQPGLITVSVGSGDAPARAAASREGTATSALACRDLGSSPPRRRGVDRPHARSADPRRRVVHGRARRVRRQLRHALRSPRRHGRERARGAVPARGRRRHVLRDRRFRLRS